MGFKEYKGVNYPEIGQQILEFWKENNIFEESVASREGNEAFTFFEGPPSANGAPGIHHVMARAVKDIICRYKTLKGYQVNRKGGWDTHGLPVELQVEKKLGITKEDIGTKISVEDYNKACRESVMEFKGQWDDLTEQIGYWVDLDNPYITFDNNYIETVWHLLQKLYKKGYLYKGESIQPYSPAAGTGLSSHELNQPGCYRDVKDTTITAQFKVVRNDHSNFLFETEDEDVRILAWTTTPWTLPSNTALAVGKGINYVKVKTVNKYTKQECSVILAKDRVAAYLNLEKEEGTIVEEYKGAVLEGVTYEQLLPYVQPKGDAFRVIIGDFVTTEDGTGIVHIAPTFGADDARVATLAGISGITVKDEDDKDVPLVNKKGCFVDEVTEFAGEPVKEEYLDEIPEGYKNVDVRIAIKLKEENKAFDVKKYEHSYPFCWRTDKPVLYYPLDSWFIKTTAVKDRMIALNKTINWKPESTGTGRFGNWLENLVDWNLSRSRYWGTPLPIWRTEDGTEEKCIGSIEELNKELALANEKLGLSNPTNLKDLHRPYCDDVFLVSEQGKKMVRESDLIDVWFDSGAMPYAQHHYPFENKDMDKAAFTADFIAEGVDQTRGWFFTLHAISVMLFDGEEGFEGKAYKNVIANGLVLDKNGNKMSKRLANGIDPFATIAKYGPDATRWYMISNAQPWDNLKFDLEGIQEVQRKFFSTFHNTYNFFALYANLDGFTYSKDSIPVSERTESDRWILSRLNSLVKLADASLADYDLTGTARAIQNFVGAELSNWYVRLNRKRFWKGEYNDDKKAAYETLFECLFTVAKISSPFAPFYFEKVYQDLNGASQLEESKSIHLSTFPIADESIIDEDLEARMELAQKTTSLAHSLRKGESIKVRQPLSKILIPVLNEEQKGRINAVADLIKSEINVKDIEFVDDASGILVKSIKANFKVLGRQYGKKMKAISQAIGKMSQDDIVKLEAEKEFTLDIDGEAITLGLDGFELAFKDIPGWLVASEGGVTVALDITITEELKKEGIARDLVNRVQNMRKDQGFEVQDKIKISVEKNDELINTALIANSAYICEETQALSLDILDAVADGTEVEMDEHKLMLAITL